MPDVTTRSKRPHRLLVGMAAVLLTALAGQVLLWTVHGHQSSNPSVPVAIVNLDQPVTTGSGQDQKTVAAGRLLAANLSQPTPAAQTPLSWELMDSGDAQSGLQDGSLYAVLTIPAGFSAALTSTSGSAPQQAPLSLVTDDAASAAVAALTKLTVNQAAAALGDQSTSSFVNSTLSSLTTIHGNLTSSASSAQTLTGSSQQLASSSHTLASSAQQVDQGAAGLDQGSSSLAAGAKSLASGATKTSTGAAQVAQGSASLAQGAATLNQGAAATATGATSLAATSQKVSTGADALTRSSAGLQDGVARLGTGTDALAAASDAVADSAQRIDDDCPATVERAYCDRVSLLAKETQAQADATRLVKADATVQSVRATAVAKGSAALGTAVSGVATGAANLSAGASQVSSGAGALSASATQLASGASGVSTGASSVARGAAQTSTGAVSLAQGASSLAGGSAQLADGSSQLAGGADQLADGNGQLSTGLTNGAAQVPSYTPAQQSQLSSVVTTPIGVGSGADNPTTVAAALVPPLLAVVLWLGTLMMFLTRSAAAGGSAWEQASATRRVLAGLLPVAAVGVVQAAVLLGLVVLSGASIDSPIGLSVLAVVGALAFAATNQALVSVFGTTGRMVSLAFAAVEAAALSGLAPIQSAPAALQAVNAVLPLPQFAEAARQLLLGGGGTLPGPYLVLLLWTGLSLAVSVLAARRQRPELADRRRPQRISQPGDLVLTQPGA